MIKYFLLVTIVILPLQFALNVSAGFDLVTTKVLVPVLFLFWLVRGLARKKIWIPNRVEVWLTVVFLFLSALSLVLGRDADAGFRKLLYLLSIFPVFFVVADVFRLPASAAQKALQAGREEWRRRGAVAVAASGTLAALVALGQFSLPFFVGIGKAVKIWEGLTPYFLGNSFGKLVAGNSSWLVNIGGKTLMRAFGFFPDPHNFAFFANLCLFFGLGYFFAQSKKIFKIWSGVAVCLMLTAVVLSFSRGAYLGLISGSIFFAIVFLRRSNLLGGSAVMAGLVLAAIVFLNSNIISQRLISSFNLKEGSNAERYKNWTQAVEIVRDNPLGGIGLGNYARTVKPTAADRSSIYAHNLFLDIAAETGILSALVFLALLLISIWRNVRNGDMIGLGVASGLIGFLVHSMFDTALYSPQVLVMLLVLIVFGMNTNSKFKTQNAK